MGDADGARIKNIVRAVLYSDIYKKYAAFSLAACMAAACVAEQAKPKESTVTRDQLKEMLDAWDLL